MIERTATDTVGTGASGPRSLGPDPTQGIETEIEKATSRPVMIIEAEAGVPHEEIDHHTLAVRQVGK